MLQKINTGKIAYRRLLGYLPLLDPGIAPQSPLGQNLEKVKILEEDTCLN
jgi:hypothetical protein